MEAIQLTHSNLQTRTTSQRGRSTVSIVLSSIGIQRAGIGVIRGDRNLQLEQETARNCTSHPYYHNDDHARHHIIPCPRAVADYSR